MRGGSSIFEPSTGPKVLFVPRRPVPKGLGENSFFARLRPVGAQNKPASVRSSLQITWACLVWTGLGSCACYVRIGILNFARTTFLGKSLIFTARTVNMSRGPGIAGRLLLTSGSNSWRLRNLKLGHLPASQGICRRGCGTSCADGRGSEARKGGGVSGIGMRIHELLETICLSGYLCSLFGSMQLLLIRLANPPRVSLEHPSMYYVVT